MQVHPVLPGSIQFSPLQTSLHPSLHLTYNATSSRPSDHLLGTACHPAGQSCSLSFQFTFPDALFLDRNELRDTFVGSEEVEHWHLAPETIDIERPVANNQEPNVLRLHLGDEGEGEVKIPLHARYLVPREEGLEEVWLFAAGESGAVHGGWVCTPSESSGEYNIAHSPLSLLTTVPLSITLPTGRPSDLTVVELGTAIAIWTCFAWLVYKIARLANRSVQTTRQVEVKLKAA